MNDNNNENNSLNTNSEFNTNETEINNNTENINPVENTQLQDSTFNNMESPVQTYSETPVIENNQFSTESTINVENTTNSFQENVVNPPLSENQVVEPEQTQTIDNQNKDKFNIKNLLKNKKVLIIAGCIILILIVILIFNGLSNGKGSNKEIKNLFNRNALIKIKKDNKYGFIDTDGKVIIQPEYTYASDYYGDFAIVSNSNDEYKVIDNKGNEKVSSKSLYSIKYLNGYNAWLIEDALYNDKLTRITDENVEVDYEDYGYLSWKNSKNKTGGIMTASGKITYTYKFEDGENYLSIEPSYADSNLKATYCIVNIENEKYAIVNCDTGKIAYNFTDKYIDDEDDNVFSISDKDTYDTEKYVFINKDKVAFEVTNPDVDITYHSSKNYFEIYDDSVSNYDDRYSYYFVATDKMLKEFDSSNAEDSIFEDEFEELTHYKKFTCDNGYGLKENDSEIVPCGWNSLEFIDLLPYQYLLSKGKNYIIGYKDNKAYIYDIGKKKAVKELNTTYVSTNELSTLVEYTDKETNNEVVLDLETLKSMSFDKNAYINIYTNYFTEKKDNSLDYYNLDFKKIYTGEK